MAYTIRTELRFIYKILSFYLKNMKKQLGASLIYIIKIALNMISYINNVKH